MTAAGTCFQCGKVCGRFHYTRPRKDAYDSHEGYWHCDEHGPFTVTATGSTETNAQLKIQGKDPTYGMNRAERRRYARTGRIPE